MKPAYYPNASSDEGVAMQFDLVCSGKARSMIDPPREQMAASGPSRHFECAQLADSLSREVEVLRPAALP
jgi:hypothetical protein